MRVAFYKNIVRSQPRPLPRWLLYTVALHLQILLKIGAEKVRVLRTKRIFGASDF